MRRPRTGKHAGPSAAWPVVAALLALAATSFAGGPRPAGADRGPDFTPHVGHHAPPRHDRPDSLVVVSYNIQYGEDLELAAAELRAHPRLAAADAYLLQEMDPAGTDALARALRCDYVYYRASVGPRQDRPFGNAVLSRWPILAHRMVLLPHEAPLTGQRRVAVAADLDVAGRRLRAVSVHASTMIAPLPDRLDQAAAAAESLVVADLPIVVGGDFNTVSAYEATLVRRRLRRLGLREARLPRGATAARTLFGFVTIDLRLDHLFYAGVEPAGTGIAAGARASDHVPIWAVFTFPDDD